MKYNAHDINIVSKNDIPEKYRYIRTQIDAKTEKAYCVYTDPVTFDDMRQTPYFLAYENTDYNLNYHLFVHGSGHMAIDMNCVFPMPKRDFSKICEYADTANNRESAAEKMHGYIAAQLAECNTELENCRDSGSKTKVIARLKKYTAMTEVLYKFFSDILPDETPTEHTEIVKTKSVVVYPLCAESGKGSFIDVSNGYRFKKFGILFHGYKNSRTKYHYAIIPSLGLSVGIMEKTKNKLIASITEKTAELIKEFLSNPEKAQPAHDKFISIMEKDGYGNNLVHADFALPIAETETATEEPKPEPETTAENTQSTEPAETAAATEPIAEPEPAEAETTAAQEPEPHAIPEKDIIGFCAEYKQILHRLRTDPLFMPRSGPADRQQRKKAAAYYDSVLMYTELNRQFIIATGDIIDTAQKAIAFTLAYYAIFNRQPTADAQTPGNGIKTHSVYYRQTMPTGHTEKPYRADIHATTGKLCPIITQAHRTPKTRHTGGILSPCMVFRTIPGSVCTCRAIVTDSS